MVLKPLGMCMRSCNLNKKWKWKEKETRDVCNHTSRTALIQPSFSGLFVTWAYFPGEIGEEGWGREMKAVLFFNLNKDTHPK